MGGPAVGGHSDGGKHQEEMSDSPDGQRRSHVPVGSDTAAESVSERAALESVSSTLLMPGEDPSSPYIPDAEHWITVYSELYNFTVGILDRPPGDGRSPETGAGLPPVARCCGPPRTDPAICSAPRLLESAVGPAASQDRQGADRGKLRR